MRSRDVGDHVFRVCSVGSPTIVQGADWSLFLWRAGLNFAKARFEDFRSGNPRSLDKLWRIDGCLRNVSQDDTFLPCPEW